jgi:hypothetical protein
MRTDKPVALKMRADGKSYKTISREMGVPKSTLCEWFKDLEWSSAIKAKLQVQNRNESRERFIQIGTANSIRWANYREAQRVQALEEFELYKSCPLFSAGVMLYWGEGTKAQKSTVRICNTDARMLAVFISFAVQFLHIEKSRIKLALLLYPDLDDNVSKYYWSEALGIPLDQFYKTQFIQGKHLTRKLAWGVCTVSLGRSAEAIRMNTWIDAFAGT